MGIFDLFSKRQKAQRGEVPDIFTYDDLPRGLRVQVVHIWDDALGADLHVPSVHNMYSFIVKTLCREYGVFTLGKSESYHRDFYQELTGFILNEKSVERLMDAIELSFRVIERVASSWDYRRMSNAQEIADDAIAELNMRFREHGVGYHFNDGVIIRVDSQFIHADVVKPALILLNQNHYAGAQQEFLKAHEHYRHGNAKEALNECLKAFESTMKTVCDLQGWSYNNNATAKNLIQVCMDRELIPTFWQNNFSSLRSLLESSIPTGRNRLGGHGQGAVATSVPTHLVAYMLHMTASAIVFLAEAEASLPR